MRERRPDDPTVLADLVRAFAALGDTSQALKFADELARKLEQPLRELGWEVHTPTKAAKKKTNTWEFEIAVSEAPAVKPSTTTTEEEQR